MIQKVFYGNTNALTSKGRDIFFHEKMILALVVLVILVMGVYPKPVMDLTRGTVDLILTKMNFKL